MDKSLKVLSLLLTTLVAGCVTGEDIRAGADTLKGKPYKAAFERLGFPDKEENIAGYKVYSWINQNSGSYTVPTYQTATSYVNGQPIFTSIQGSQTETYNHYCKLSIIVDQSGIVTDTKVEGNLGGCERYARLSPKKKT